LPFQTYITASAEGVSRTIASPEVASPHHRITASPLLPKA
jgi:hypothetical protein